MSVTNFGDFSKRFEKIRQLFTIIVAILAETRQNYMSEVGSKCFCRNNHFTDYPDKFAKCRKSRENRENGHDLGLS